MQTISWECWYYILVVVFKDTISLSVGKLQKFRTYDFFLQQQAFMSV